MKKHFFRYLLLACLLLAMPLQAFAAEPVPAAGATTTLSDSRYFNQGWLAMPIVFTHNDSVWAMGVSELKDVPVALTYNSDGALQCTFLDTTVIDVFLNAINTQMAAADLEDTSNPIFDNGQGTYIYNAGETVYQLNDKVKQWLLDNLQYQLLYSAPAPMQQELDSNFLKAIVKEGNLTYSSNFALAGSCTTSFSGSSSNRINNIKVASGRLNDMVIMPGQEVSVSTVIQPRTAGNGYKEAGVYLNGETVQAYGGGICQVSSTAYNAVKNAGLTVLERHPHSMPVHYLPLGLDAAISAGSKDMRFRNDYSTPVILQAYTEGKKLTINVLVWNEELNGRSFKLWAKKTGSLSAKTYFTTYQDGEEVSTEFVGNSSYMAPKPKNTAAEDE